MPNEKYVTGIRPLITTQEPMGCHLQAIGGVDGCFSFKSGADQFDRLLERNHGQGDGFRGEYFTGTIVSISDDSPQFAATVKELKSRGFKLLGTQSGAHGSYKMCLYGKGFTLPAKKTKKEKSDVD